MVAETFKNVLSPRNQVLWVLLAFQSGFMNAGGFLACHQFVSHMTGYGTNVGLSLGTREYQNAIELAMAPLFFLMGAAYAGWLVDRRLILGEEPKIITGITTMAAMNIVIYVSEISGYLGEFGEKLVFQRDFVLLFCLCFACGLQNGLFTGITKGAVRTTHLTGPTTDIGIGLAKIFSHHRDSPERRELVALNWLRVKIVLMFSSGSLIAVLIFPTLGHEGFAIPGVTSLFLAWYARKLVKLAHGTKAEREETSLLVPAELPAGVR